MGSSDFKLGQMLGLVLGLLWPGIPVWAQSTFGILGQPVLTLQPIEGQSSQERLMEVEQRFQTILAQAPDATLTVQVSGDAEQAEIRINNQLLVSVTPADAEANSTRQVDALAQLWGQQLTAALNQSQSTLLKTAELPQTLMLAGRVYQRLDQDIADLGRFVTDGTRIGNQVVYWEISAQNLGSVPYSEPLDFPDPPPTQLFVLNRYRTFVGYQAPP